MKTKTQSNNETITVGTTVTWTSQALGCTKTKTGTVVAVVPPREHPLPFAPQGSKVDASGMPRPKESYLVKVEGRKALYWPHASRLKVVEQPESLSPEECVDHLIETCVPGGDLCDPQVVADNIRRYFDKLQSVTLHVRAAPEPSTDLPTEQGLYWWREEKGEKWILVKAAPDDLGVSKAIYHVLDPYEHRGWMRYTTFDLWAERYGIGQWLPCLPPESEVKG